MFFGSPNGRPDSKMSKNYTPPEWSNLPVFSFFFDVIKSGVELDPIDLSLKPFYCLGRQPTADIILDHPSASRLHAVIQHGSNGIVKIMDMGSTHGTFLNKLKIESNKFVDLRIGDVIKFGESTRLFVLNGPDHLRVESAVKKPSVMSRVAKVEKEGSSSNVEMQEDMSFLKNRECTWGLPEEDTIEVEEFHDFRAWLGILYFFNV